MPLTKATYAMISGTKVNVLDFGADNTGATSSVIAFQNAIAYCQANNKTLYLPAGKYLIDTPVNTEVSPLYNFSMVGEGDGHSGLAGNGRTVIDMTGNTTYAFAMGYSMRISNFMVANGTDFIHWNSSGLDANTTRIDNVTAVELAGAFFKVYTAGNGSQIVMSNCQFVQYSSGTNFSVFDNLSNDISTDSLTLRNCWVETISNATFKISAVRFQISDTRLVPYSSDGYWITIGGMQGAATVNLDNTDFGGENGGRKLLSCSVSGYGFTFTNCGIFCAGKTVMDFYAAPSHIIMNDCSGFIDAQPGIINFDDTLSDAEKAKINSAQIKFTRSDDNSTINAYIATTSNLAYAEIARQPDVPVVDRICTVDDLVGSSGSPWLTSTSSSGLTSTTLPDSFGSAGFNFPYEVTSSTGQLNVSFSNSFNINTLANGSYTFEVCLTCTGNTALSLNTNSSKNVKQFNFVAGCYQACMPFTLSTDSVRSVSFSVAASLGTKFSVSRIRIWKGSHVTRAVNIYGSSAPSASTNVWFVNDRVINSSPTVGQPKSWICTVAGTPGTWVSEGNL